MKYTTVPRWKEVGRETPGSEHQVRIVYPYWPARQRRRIQSKQTGHGRREPMRAKNPSCPCDISTDFFPSGHNRKKYHNSFSVIYKYIEILYRKKECFNPISLKRKNTLRFRLPRSHKGVGTNLVFVLAFRSHCLVSFLRTTSISSIVLRVQCRRL